MFLDTTTTHLWKFWDEGYYYDSTHSLWRNWDGIWSKLWAYQLSCFVWATGEYYDTDLLSWVIECPSPKIKILNSQFAISSVWRNNQLYIDASSSQMIELGTKQYPYKTAKAAFSEILNIYSHKQVNITLFIKEYSNLFMEDDNFILNMTSMTITSYSDLTDSPSRATIIPTDVSQQRLSKRSAFNLLKNTDLQLNEVLQASTFSSIQKLLILKERVTFTIAMSNFYLNNIDVRRDPGDIGKDTVFIFPINQGSLWVDIRNSVLNMTGTIAFSSDPLNGYFENIKFDTSRIKDGFYFPISCNYPEAALTNSIAFTGITTFQTTNRTLYLPPRLIFNSGPGNFTLSNIDIQNYGTSFKDYTMSATFSTSSSCQPNDGALQTIDFHGWYLTMPNLPIGSDLINGILIRSDYSLYRKIILNITDMEFDNFIPANGPMILASGTFNQEVYLSNINIANFSLLNSLISIYSYNKVVINTIKYNGWEGSYASSLMIQVSQNVEIHNLYYNNITSIDKSEVSPLISLYNFDTTQTVVDTISVINSILHYAPIVKFYNALNNLSITGFNLQNVSFNKDTSMIFANQIKSLTFANHTYSNLFSLDLTDEDSSILYIGNFDLSLSSNSSLSNIDISNSEISLMKFNGIINTPSKSTYINIQNVSFTDSSFKTSRSLIEISNLENNVNLNLVFSNLMFTLQTHFENIKLIIKIIIK